MFASHNLRTPLGRARGLGSAKDGLHHWWVQRLTAIALVPLAVWFVFSVVGLAHSDFETFRAWLGRPQNATLMALFFGAALHHAHLGVQVVIEDYVASHAWRIGSVIAVKLTCYGLAALGIISTLIVTFGG